MTDQVAQPAPMPPLNKKAIAVGAVIDIGGGMVLGVLYTVTYMVLLASQKIPPTEWQGKMLADPVYYVVNLVMGLAFIALGGYVAARMARVREIDHAVWVALVGIALSVLVVAVTDTSEYPSWYLPVSFALTIPTALVGGYIARRRTTELP